MFKRFCTILAFIGTTQSALAVTVDSYYDNEGGHFVTDASVDLNAAHELTAKIGNDFSHYRDWALKGINGAEGNPRRFISLIKDVLYHEDQKPYGYFMVIYDVDLPIPFNRSDEQLKFTLANYKATDGKVEEYSLVLDDSSMVIRNFTLSFKLTSTKQGATRISFHSEFALRALFNTFFSLERYRHNIEWRIIRMVENLQEHTKTLQQDGKTARRQDGKEDIEIRHSSTPIKN